MTSGPVSSSGRGEDREPGSTARPSRPADGVWTRSIGERRNQAGKLELVGIEASDPRWVRASIDGLVETAHRLRALGAIAITLCEVAAARLDGMVTLIRPAASTARPGN